MESTLHSCFQQHLCKIWLGRFSLFSLVNYKKISSTIHGSKNKFLINYFLVKKGLSTSWNSVSTNKYSSEEIEVHRPQKKINAHILRGIRNCTSICYIVLMPCFFAA